jgi:hypothetical protein
LAEGVKPEKDRGSFDRTMEIYRDLFDCLFSYLEEINHYIDIGLVSSKQVASLKYWLNEISSPRFGEPVRFGPFIDHYGYEGVRSLMTKFGVNQAR